MSKKLIAVAVALASMSAINARADIFDSSMFSVKGFGTVGVAHSSEEHADFIATQFQPSGTGLSHDWDMATDSKLGLQLNANFTDKLSAVLQVVSQYQYDNTWRPMVEWANVKYQFTPEFSVRLGRIVLPAFLISDSRMVGYSNPWIRPPEEVYFNSLTTSNDGGDISYRSQFSGLTNTVQAFYGESKARLSGSTLKGKSDWGINDTVEIDALTLRAGYVSYKVDFESSGLEQLLGGIGQFAEAAAQFLPEQSAQASALVNTYNLNDIKIGISSLGASYDPGNWFAMSEYVHVKGDSFIADSNSYYVTGGYRIQQFTPYLTLSQVKTDRIKEDGISTAGVPAIAVDSINMLNGGVQAILANSTASQRTFSAGVRWDFMPSADFKIQYEWKSLLDDTTGRLLLPHDGSSYQGGDHFNVISAAIDFVF